MISSSRDILSPATSPAIFAKIPHIPTCISYSSNEQSIYIGTKEGLLMIYDLRGARLRDDLASHCSSGIHTMKMDNTEEYLVTGETDGTLKVTN